MRQPTWRKLGMVLIGCVCSIAQAAPQVTAVLNAASYVLPGLPNGGVAQGSMVLVYGTDLGPSQLMSASPPLSRTLGETVVHVSADGFEEDCYLFYTYSTLVAAVMPSKAPVGSVKLTVTYRGTTSNALYVYVGARRPGLLTRNQAGHGAATLQNYNSALDQPVNSPALPAYPGQVGILWGTGLGAIQGDDGILPPVGNLPAQTQVVVGSKTTTAQYAGRSGQFPAIDQINFGVPDGVTGCHVPLAFAADGIMSNYTTMAIAAKGKNCTDPTYLSEREMATAVQKGELRVGVINLGRVRSVISSSGATGPTVADAGAGEFLKRTMAELHSGAGGIDLYSSLGSCYWYPLRESDRTEWFPFEIMNNSPLDAGQALNLSGARGTKTIALNAKGSFAASLGSQDTSGQGTLFLEPGDYAVDNGAGGTDVGPFRASLKIPAPITWTNRTDYATSVVRGTLRIEWTGGDPAREFVFISGASVDATAGLMRGFLCTERADAKRFDVPPHIVGYLPVSRAPAGTSVPTGVLSVGTLPLPETVKFTASGLDVGYLFYSSQVMQQTEYR